MMARNQVRSRSTGNGGEREGGQRKTKKGCGGWGAGGGARSVGVREKNNNEEI